MLHILYSQRYPGAPLSPVLHPAANALPHFRPLGPQLYPKSTQLAPISLIHSTVSPEGMSLFTNRSCSPRHLHGATERWLLLVRGASRRHRRRRSWEASVAPHSFSSRRGKERLESPLSGCLFEWKPKTPFNGVYLILYFTQNLNYILNYIFFIIWSSSFIPCLPPPPQLTADRGWVCGGRKGRQRGRVRIEEDTALAGDWPSS